MIILVSFTILGCLVQDLRADVSEFSNTDRHYLPPDHAQELAGSSSAQSLNISPGLGQYNHYQKDNQHEQKYDQHHKYDFQQKHDQHQHQKQNDHHSKDDRKQNEDHQHKHDHQNYYDHHKDHDQQQYSDHHHYNDYQKNYNEHHQKKDDHRQQHDYNDHKSESKVSNNIKLSLPKALSAAPNVARSNLEILFDDSQVKNAPKKALFTPTGNGKGASTTYSSYSNSKTDSSVLISKKSQHHTIAKTTKVPSKFQRNSSDISSKTSSRNQPGKSGINKSSDRNDRKDKISNNNQNISKTKPASLRLTSTPTIGTKRQQSQRSSSSSSQSGLRNRDHEFTSSGSQAPEVIYKPGDEINFNHVSLYDNLNKEESAKSGNGIDTVKLADGYHYATPKNGFLN